MSNIIVLPLIVPVITAILLVFLRQNIMIQRILSLCTLGFVIFISVVLLLEVQQQGVMRIDFSGWLPPFGILFVADSFAVLLVLVANIVAAICIVYAFLQLGNTMKKCISILLCS